MALRDPRLDAAIHKAQPYAQQIFVRVRDLMHVASPDIEEDIRWGTPTFMYKGSILAGFAAFKAYCALAFWKHKLLAPRLPAADANALEQCGRMTSIADLPDDRTVTRLIKAAVKLQDDGIKEAPRPKPPKDRTIAVPPYLKTALSKNKKAQTAFKDFSYSHKKEYVEWLADAKTKDTRSRRLATAVGWIAEGKPRNWKYMR
jgi:uncharacterized protein YdeI (YjbR/CyaY-like superfamily)